MSDDRETRARLEPLRWALLVGLGVVGAVLFTWFGMMTRPASGPSVPPEEALVERFRAHREKFDQLTRWDLDNARIADSLRAAGADDAAYAVVGTRREEIRRLESELGIQLGWGGPGGLRFYSVDRPRPHRDLVIGRGYLHCAEHCYFRVVPRIDTVAVPDVKQSIMFCRRLEADWYLCRQFTNRSYVD